MSKIKDFCSKTFGAFNEVFTRYPVSVCLIIITTLFVTIFLDSDMIERELFSKILMFLATSFIGTFFSENMFKKKNLLIIANLVAGCISCLFVKIIPTAPEAFAEKIILLYCGYILILFIFSLYKILLDSKLKFNEYVFRVFSNIFKSAIIYIILAIGITLISFAFMELIFENTDFDIIVRINILLFGLYYVIALVNAISKSEIEENKFINGIVKFVLLPLVTAAFLIIYMYIIKILVLKEIPSNTIFPILSILFIAAFPIWNMAERFVQNKLVFKISRALPYAYVPFVFLEIYAISTRISQYGYTPTRYMGILFLIIQIAALILTFLEDRKYISKLFIVGAIVTFASTTIATPPQISRISQKNILEKYMPEGVSFESLPDETKTKVNGAYYYLKWEVDDTYIPDNVKAEKELIEEYDIYTESQDTEYIYLWNNTGHDISGFNKLVEVYAYSYENTEAVELRFDYDYKEDISSNIIIDMTDYVNEIILNYEDGDEILENNVIVIDENTKISIRNIDINYDMDNDEIIYFSINGYLLEK